MKKNVEEVKVKKISIITDSTSDLSKALLEKYDICVLPLRVHLGTKEYQDGVDITPEELYEWSDANKETPKTSTVSLVEVQEYLEKILQGAEKIIFFCISQQMSSFFSVVTMAVEEMEATDRVFVIDSENLSTGIGLQIMEAAVMAEQGMEAEQIVEKIKEMQPYVRASFVVDTLTYLHRGGRCSGVAAIAGGALKLHPCISVAAGEMKVGKKYRGKMTKVIHDYVADLHSSLENARTERVFITHSGCSDEILRETKRQIEEKYCFKEIYITRAGSVISSHCGPGTLGVLFVENETGQGSV